MRLEKIISRNARKLSRRLDDIIPSQNIVINDTHIPHVIVTVVVVTTTVVDVDDDYATEMLVVSCV